MSAAKSAASTSLIVTAVAAGMLTRPEARPNEATQNPTAIFFIWKNFLDMCFLISRFKH